MKLEAVTNTMRWRLGVVSRLYGKVRIVIYVQVRALHKRLSNWEGPQWVRLPSPLRFHRELLGTGVFVHEVI